MLANKLLVMIDGRSELGIVLRYVDGLPEPKVDHYFGLDVRVAVRVLKSLEVSIVGQNLLDKHHLEYIPSSPAARQIERNIYGKLTWRWVK